MNANNFGKITAAKVATLKRYFENEGPEMVARETIRFIDKNFRLQGWQGVTFRPWKPNKKGTQILVRKGDLRRGFNFRYRGNGEVEFYNNIPYAGIHNTGGIISRPAHSETFLRNRHTTGKKAKAFGGQGLFKKGTTPGQGYEYKPYIIEMPQRQFAPIEDGDAPMLYDAIVKELTQQIKNILTF